MSSSHPDRALRRRLERNHRRLTGWKRNLLLDLGNESDAELRGVLRRLVTAVEAAVFDVERLLHPMNGGQS